MAKDPAFLFYPNDWLGGTMGMTFEDKGAYMELLMLQFNRGHMTKDMIGRTVGQLWVNIKDKFIEDENGCFFNERLEQEKNKRKAFSESRRNNRKGVNQYTKNKEHKSGHMTLHMENENENKDLVDNNINESFEKFWNLYDKKQGRTEVNKKWRKLKEVDRQEILQHVPLYVAATPDKQYRKNAMTYLNQKTWKDEELPTRTGKDGQIIRPETQEEKDARIFMETIKDYNTHKTLYGEESANKKFNQNVQPNLNNNRLT